MSQWEEFDDWYAEHGWKYVSSREGSFVTWKAATEALRQRVAELEMERDEALRVTFNPSVLEEMNTLTAERDALKQQKDGLVAALETIIKDDSHNPSLMVMIAEESIASVKEKAK